MKITLHPTAGKLPVAVQHGIQVRASYEDILKACTESSHLFVDTDEYVAGITLTDTGIVFQIKKLVQ